jgi:transcription termination/antitermination protein NusG
MPSSEASKWLVFYTKSRQEKKVRDLLIKLGFEVFLPLQKVMRQWSDRKKRVETPLFNSYIFVHDQEDRIPFIVQTPGIAWNIRHNGKPAVLREDELVLIKRFLESGFFVDQTVSVDFEKGERAELIDGPLKGLQGTFLRESEGGKFSFIIDSIGQSIVISVDPQIVKKLKT